MNATPEQMRVFRRRRKAWYYGMFTGGVVFFLCPIIAHSFLSDSGSNAFGAIGGFFLLVGMLLFTVCVYRCPACEQHFGKDADAERVRCPHCKTEYPIRPKHESNLS
jgi:DNA-directed RNA polymerase subunit RPC12/RpoP